jgi:hypothetical protein
MNSKAEKVEVKFIKVVRKAKSGDLAKDLKEGYVYFDVHLDANGKKLVLEKRVRLDKPERMLDKFMTKIVNMAEEKYKEARYYVAQLEPPQIETKLVNEEKAKDSMLPVFEEVNHYTKTGNIAALATSLVEF